MIARLRRRHRATWWTIPLLGVPIATWAALFPVAAPQVEPPAIPTPDQDTSAADFETARVAAWPGQSFFLATLPGRDGVGSVAVGPRSAVERLAITPWVVLGTRFEIGAELGTDVVLLGRVNEFHSIPAARGVTVSAGCVAVYDSTRQRVVAARALDPLDLSAETCS